MEGREVANSITEDMSRQVRELTSAGQSGPVVDTATVEEVLGVGRFSRRLITAHSILESLVSRLINFIIGKGPPAYSALDSVLTLSHSL